MIEAIPSLIPEFSIGTKIFILQHCCRPEKLGLIGTITELNNGKADTAECNDCHQEISIDWKTVRNKHN